MPTSHGRLRALGELRDAAPARRLEWRRQKHLNPAATCAVVLYMSAHREPSDAEQRPNMWEELNRPRDDHRRPAPVSPAPSIEFIDEPTGGGESRRAETKASLFSIDPQHLLVVGAALFIGIAFVAVSGLGSSSADEQADATPTTVTTPDRLAAVDDEPSPTPESTVTTSTAPVAEAMAMGLPAALLDSAQSQVFRLYRTALGREPDRSGFEFWSDQVRDGAPLDQLANEFLASAEFQEQFEADSQWDDRAERLLTNAFGAPSDPAVLDEWQARFAGLDGAQLLLAISESDETLAATGTLR